MVLVYVAQLNPRIAYSFKLVLTTILGVEVEITAEKEAFERSSQAKINYSNESLSGIQIIPDKLLFETGCHAIEPQIIFIDGIPCLFPVCELSAMPFDPFAAAFFMVSRYEEYRSQPLDKHDRLMATESFAFKHDFLDIPVVDAWAYLLKALLLKAYPGLVFPARQYRHIPTIDVDIAFAHLHHGFIRTIGGTLKNLMKGNFHDVYRRYLTFIHKEKDPFDVFDQLEEWFSKLNTQPVFFFLIGKYGAFDRNISSNNRAMQQLIRKIGTYAKTGVHPSYASNANYHLLKEEVRNLEQITGEKVIRSRQHFLKLTVPKTIQWLEQCGITEDYSMGYASHPGFRAGTCTPFLFYDISLERETSVLVHPVIVMDGTLNEYLKLTKDEASRKIFEITQKIRDVDGTFFSLWHNTSFTDTGIWKNWKILYKKMLESNNY